MAKKKNAKKGLTGKQRRFVAEFIVDLNATAAAERSGYSLKTAYSLGQRLLKNAEIQRHIQESMEKREKRTSITQDMVVQELARIAFSDPRDIASWGVDGVKLKSSEEITDDQAASISEISETITEKGSNLRIKRADKVKALELLGRHLAMFTDKQEHSGKVAAEVQLFRIPDNGRD